MEAQTRPRCINSAFSPRMKRRCSGTQLAAKTTAADAGQQQRNARCSFRLPAVASQQRRRISNRCAAPAAQRQPRTAQPTPAASAWKPKYAGRSTAAPAPLAARRAKDDAPIIKSHRYTRAGGGHPPRPRSWGAGAPCFGAHRFSGRLSDSSRAKTFAPSAPPQAGPPPARRAGLRPPCAGLIVLPASLAREHRPAR